MERTGGLFWYSVFVNFSSPIFVVVFFYFFYFLFFFFVAVNRDEVIVRKSFSVKLFYILHNIRLSSTFYEPSFLSMWSSVFVFCCFFLNPMPILHELLEISGYL